MAIWIASLVVTLLGWLLVAGWHRFSGGFEVGAGIVGISLVGCFLALWRPKARMESLSLFGVSLVLLALAIVFVTPRVVNAGSGQDAVDLGSMVVGFFVACAGALLGLIGAVATWLERGRKPA